MQKQSVVIIGAGGCGTAVFVQLAEALLATHNTSVSITVIGRDARFGPGLPYGTQKDSNLLNMKAQAMGIFAERPLDFAEWVRQQKDTLRARYGDIDLDADPFPPRSVYGLYLEARLQEKIKEANAAGIDARLMHDTVQVLHETTDGIQIDCESGDALHADYAVLALGNFPSTQYQELQGTEGYFHSPWPDSSFLPLIHTDEAVGILGSRLTAVDTALMLATNGHRGKITLCSRNGLLPKVQGPRITPDYERKLWDEVSAARKLDGSLRFPDLVRILKENIETACGHALGWESILHPTGSGKDIFLSDVAAAGRNDVRWQDVLSSTSNIIENFWHWLSDEDKQRFMREYCSLWFVYRHAMPMKNAGKIAALLESGQLSTRAGLVSVHKNDATGMFDISCSDERRTGHETLSVRYLINATGEGLDAPRIRSPLLQSLLRDGTVVPHPCGGIAVEFDTCAVIGPQGLSQKLYALGSLTRGTHLYTNDMHRNAVHAKRIVDDMMEKLKASSPAPHGSIR